MSANTAEKEPAIACRLHYFTQGLYYQGGMGKLCHAVHYLSIATGMMATKNAICNARDLTTQRRLWNGLTLIRFLKHGPALLVRLFVFIASLIFFNRLILWYGGGVPAKQFELIQKDKVHISDYIGRTFDGVAQNSHLRKDNYFYYNCLMGRFARDNCPTYLKPESVKMLRDGGLKRLDIVTGTFLDALRSAKYTKVILMDHVDWLDEGSAREVARTLRDQVLPGGKVIWRSASVCPPYAAFIAAQGFDVVRLAVATSGYMDRVNMYSSFYCAVRHRS
jgi:betaine lipid synthase